MNDPLAFGNPSLGTASPLGASGSDQRLARVSALAALTVVFAGIAYSREIGFTVYAVPFAIPYVVFVVARSSRTWQAWGWALPWVVIALALVPAVFTALRIMRSPHRSQIAILVFLMALLLTQVTQLIFVRRAFSGTIAFGRPLFRAALYYVCLLIAVAATLPNWYVPPLVRHQNKAVESLRKYSTAMESYAKTSKDASYPPNLAALLALRETGTIASSGTAESELICDQTSCVGEGYRFEYHPMFKQGLVSSYTISARPLEFEETGTDSFLLTADGKIHQTPQNRDALPTDATSDR